MIVGALLLNRLLLPYTLAGDGARRYAALTQLLSGHGVPTIKYSLIGPIFAAPLWYLGRLAGNSAPWVETFSLLVFGGGLLALYLLLRREVEPRLLRAFLLLLTLASMVPYHLTQFYGEVFTAAPLAVGLGMVALRRRGKVTALALAALAVANTPATIVGLAVAMVKRIWDTRRLRYALAVVAAVVFVLMESLLRRGTALNDGYLSDSGGHTLMPFAGIPGFSYPLLFGLLAVLFSFGKGLVFFIPGLFLPVRRRIAALWGPNSRIWSLYTLWLGVVVGLVLVYSKWWAWYGGWFWGPRFFLFACFPAAFALALWTQRPSKRLWVNLLALLALGLSVWVGINGAVFNQSDLKLCTVDQYEYESLCHFTPDYSALWRPLVNLYLYGPGAKFASVSGLTPTTVAFGLYALAVGVYLAVPLLRAIWAQGSALARAQAPRLAGLAREFRI